MNYVRFALTTVTIFIDTTILLVCPPDTRGQTVIDNLWVTNGTVRAIATSGNTTYIGGEFTYVGPPTGHIAAIATETAQLDCQLPIVNGDVCAIITDGVGGWYIGGLFTKVGDVPRNNIAHIKPDGSVDAVWNPDVNGKVYALAISGSIVYVGGGFTSVGDSVRNHIAAIDASTGFATKWNPNAGGSYYPYVYALAVSGSTVYAGGGFTSLGGQSRNYLAALDTATGAVTGWNPNPNGVVEALAIRDSLIYIGGYFTSIGGQLRNCLAAIHVTTGIATSWNPDANGGSTPDVLAIALSESTIYAGGSFTSVGGQPRNYLVAIDAVTGLATDWNPNPNNWIFAISVIGSTVYIGGYFTSTSGQPRNCIAAIDATTGNVTSWDPYPNSWVYALATTKWTIYAGGHFMSIGGKQRNCIAAINATTGIATDWNPNVRGPNSYDTGFYTRVEALAVSGSTIYAGGLFTSVGDSMRNNVAEIDTATGQATGWNPNVGGSYPFVYALTIRDSLVYVGGSFTSIGGQPRNCIAAVDASTGLVTSWNPDADRWIYTLAVKDSTVYAGGYFTSVGGQPRSCIATINVSTGRATDWNPSATSLFSIPNVRSLVLSGSTVYIGGNFTSVGTQSRNNIAAIDASTGTVTGWNPHSNSTVFALAISDSTVYVGGHFSSIGGQARNCIAAIDASTGLAKDWNPNASGGGGPEIFTIATSGSTIYTGGVFTNIGNAERWGFAGLSVSGPTEGILEPTRRNAAPTRYALEQNYPNPFNPLTVIRYSLIVNGYTTLRVFDVLGREIATLVDEVQAPGEYSVQWNAENVPSGMYFYRLQSRPTNGGQAGTFTQTRKMVLIQ